MSRSELNNLKKIIPCAMLMYIYAPPTGAKSDRLKIILRLIVELIGPEAFMRIVEQTVEEVAERGR